MENKVEKKRGRKEKVSKHEVRDFIEASGEVPTDVIALNFGVAPSTIRRRLRQLQRDGCPVLPTSEGQKIFEVIKTERDAHLVINLSTWLTRLIVSMARISAVTRKPFIQSIKRLHLTGEERRSLRQPLMLITRQMEIQDIEEELTT